MCAASQLSTALIGCVSSIVMPASAASSAIRDGGSFLTVTPIRDGCSGIVDDEVVCSNHASMLLRRGRRIDRGATRVQVRLAHRRGLSALSLLVPADKRAWVLPRPEQGIRKPPALMVN